MITPIEEYDINGNSVFVKREDLSFQYPAPPFSKCRGLIAHLKMLKKNGINSVAYTETPISMAGWGVCWAAKKLKMEVIIFEPVYKKGRPEMLEKHRNEWLKYNPIIYELPAGRTCVNQHYARKILKEHHPQTELLPIGISFPESVKETAKEFKKSIIQHKWNSVVVSVGSGTICAGILKGMTESHSDASLFGILVNNKNEQHQCKKIWEKSGEINTGLLKTSNVQFTLINDGWEYTQFSNVKSPFPCHAFYDLKAWEWLTINIKKIVHPVLFWNIGSEII